MGLKSGSVGVQIPKVRTFFIFFTQERREMWEGPSEPRWKGEVIVRIFLNRKQEIVMVRNWQLSWPWKYVKIRKIHRHLDLDTQE